MELFEAVKKRQSVRSYKPEKVPHELLRELILYAQWAPTSCNLQLTEYIIVDDEKVLEELAGSATKKFTWGSTFIIFIYDPRFTVKRGATLTSLGASMQNILLAATHYGLAACPMAGFGKDRAIKRILNIPAPYEIGLIMSIGYAKEPFIKDRDRVPEERVLHWNGYSGKQNILNDSRNLDTWSFGDLVNYRERMAPVYLYNNVFHLHIFSKKTFEMAFERLKKYLKPGVRILDLISYDGIFAKILTDANDGVKLTVSDIILYTLKILKQNFSSAETVLIRGNYTLPLPDASFDIVTMAHKAEFMPENEMLFKEAHRLLKPAGIFFVTTTEEKFLKRILYKLRNFKRKWINGEVMNVYENSPYYRIGPMKPRSGAFLDEKARAVDFTKLEGGTAVVPASGLVPHRFLWRVYKK